jgi:hypothetical protein
LINTTPTIHWISEMYKMINEEQDKFDELSSKPHDIKLLVDFNPSNKEMVKNQMEIPVIKYKKKNILKKEDIDLRGNKGKNQNSLF